MRKREYGKFATEFIDFSGRTIGGTSIIIDGYTQNNDQGGWNIGDGRQGDDAWYFASGGWSRKSFHKIKLSRLRSELGHTPVIIRARWYIHTYSYDGSYPQNGHEFALFRVLPGRITHNEATYRYRATGVTYEGDGYSPLHGTDVAATPFSTSIFPRRTQLGYYDYFDITNELLYKLRANEDLEFLLRWLPLGTPKVGYLGMRAYWDHDGHRPYLEIIYLNNLEFFRSDPITGEIDLTEILDNTTGDSSDWLYLGAMQRGETSTPVKFFIRNFADRMFPLIVVWRAAPDWTIPVQTSGSGTGKLDYVVLDDAAVWQKYTVTFTSATSFTVKADAYRANPVGLNPTGGGPGWTGTTATTWTAPAGGLTIPATAWQPGTAVNDTFEFFVMGTATDPAWAADADDQVQITDDVGGAPRASGWRSIAAAYTRTTAGVTINATTIKIPTRALKIPSWIIGSPCFIGNDANVHEGQIAATDAAAIGPPNFTGVGLNDLTISGNYNGVWDGNLVVEIDGIGTTDTFRWSTDNGATWAASGVAITGAPQLLTDGIFVTFGATTGHTMTDRWTMAVTAWGITIDGLTADNTMYPAGAVVSTGLPIRNLSPGVWTKTAAPCGASYSPANRIPVVSSSGFADGDTIAVQSVENSSDIDIRIIATGGIGPDYIDLTANLTSNFETGSIVAKFGSGERPIWARVVATQTTNEEIKIFRISART